MLISSHVSFSRICSFFSVFVVGCVCVEGRGADRNFSGANKPTSTNNITSIDVYIKPGTTVTPPAPWTDSGQRRGDTHRFVGGNLAPGQSSGNFNGHNPNGSADSYIIGGDYANGTTVSMCPDPVSSIAISGGPSGSSYLGYNIPANQWGYFYEVWNTPDFTDSTLSTTVEIGAGIPVSNLQVINNSFTVAAIDKIVPMSPSNDTYQFFAPFMDPSSASGGPGVATLANLSAGNLTMTFPNGMSANQTSSVVGYTSPSVPSFGDGENVYSNFASLGQCPKSGYNFVVTPAPEPGTVTLIVIGMSMWITKLRRR
jgi:hypothetical protein